MAVYVDKLIDWGWRLGPSCHLIADSLDELHDFAQRLGLKRAWFQSKSLPHYDLTVGRREKAVQLGAVELDRYAFVDAMKRIRAEQWEADYALFQKVGLIGMTDPEQKARTLRGLKARALISW